MLTKLFMVGVVLILPTFWILKKIIEMAEGLGTHVLCEGVETAEQVQVLAELGCDTVQGFFFGKPEAEERFYDLYM